MSILEVLYQSVAAPWRLQARCQDADPDTFFPPDGHNVDHARLLCGQCPVAGECLDEALKIARSDDFGVWGGTSPQERETIRRERGIVGMALGHERNRKPCGNPAAYARHLRLGEDPCPLCREAESAYRSAA